MLSACCLSFEPSPGRPNPSAGTATYISPYNSDMLAYFILAYDARNPSRDVSYEKLQPDPSVSACKIGPQIESWRSSTKLLSHFKR